MSLTSVSSTVIDSILFRDAFGTPAMREVFSDRRLIERYIEVEVALARAEARCGVITAEAAEVRTGGSTDATLVDASGSCVSLLAVAVLTMVASA